jgi:hypothetical protein
MVNNDRSNVMMTSAAANASSGSGGAADAANIGSNNATASASTVPSSAILRGVSGGDLRASTNLVSDDATSAAAANSEAARRISKESLASSTASDAMFDTQTQQQQQQQANLLNLLQRQQIQMGNLNAANNNSVAAMAMMLQQQQQGGGGGNVVNGGGGGGAASHRNSLTGSVVNTPGSSFTMGGATDVNSFLMNMNYNNMKPNTTNATDANNGVPTTNSNSNNKGEKGPLLLIPPKKSKNKHKQTFAMKLMNILSIKECQSSIRWMPNGLSFCIVDPKLLVEKVLPVYFKEAKYTSFTRKLNRWGFKHYSLPINESTSTSAIADKEMSIYSHDKFRRDDPGLCHDMDGGHRRRNALKEDEKTRQLYSQLKPEVRDLLRQGQLQQQQGVVAGLVADTTDGAGAAGGGGGVGVGMEGVIGSDNQLAPQAPSSASNVVPNAATVAGLEVQLQQMQAMQLQLLQQQAQQQQQQQQSNQMMDMSSFMSNNAAASMLGAAAGGANNGMAASAMGGDSTLKNNFLLASANQQGLMGLNMMGGGGDVGTGGNDNMNTNAAMAAAAMTAAAQGGQLSNTLGMRRTSLGFMPYLPVGNVGRRDSLGSVFSVGNCHTFDGKIESTFDDVVVGGGGLNNTSTAGVTGADKEGYEPGTSGGGGEPTSKLNVLQGVIANEQMKQQQNLAQSNTSNNDGLNAV